MGDKDKQWQLYSTKCCNPFLEDHKTDIVKNLRNVATWMCSLENFEIKSGMKICSKCRKKLYKLKPKETSLEEYEMAGPSNEVEPDFTDKDTSLEMLNKSLSFINESPVVKKKFSRSKEYAKSKLDKVKTSLEAKLFCVSNQQKLRNQMMKMKC